MRDDGTVQYYTVEHFTKPPRLAPKARCYWAGIGEGFWMTEYHEGRRLPYRSEAPHWDRRVRMLDGSEGWVSSFDAELAYADCTRIFGDTQWRIVRKTVTLHREVITPSLCFIDC